MVHDGEAVAEAVCLFHVVSRVEDGHAGVAEFLHGLEDVIARLWVYADGRLVEEQQLGAAHESDGEVHAALHAAGEVVHLVAGAVEQPYPFEVVAGGVFGVASAQSGHSAEEDQVVGGGEFGVQRQLLRADAYQLADFVAVRGDRVAAYGDVPVIGSENC